MLELFLASLQAVFSIASSCPEMGACDGCGDEYFEISRMSNLPDTVSESSGVAIFNQLLFTHGDSAGEPVLYALTSPFVGDVALEGVVRMPDGFTNTDWEDLAIDEQNNIYIGDFGNNSNDRRDLSIIKFDPYQSSAASIKFRYEDQTDFPAKRRKDRNFDFEAFFWARGSLYLFSKNKGDNDVRVYALPDQAGEHVARVIDTLKIEHPITSADISPDGRLMVLLSYGKVFLYGINWVERQAPLFEPLACINFRRSGQSEAITFIDNYNWLITNEKGRVFWMKAREEFLPEMEETIRYPEIDGANLDDRLKWE